MSEALAEAEKHGLDLIEIAPTAKPPVAKIMDFGKFRYLESKKQKLARQRSQVTETKSLQVKLATGDHDLAIKAAKASEFLDEGHRVKIDLFLRGRAKYLESKFLAERLERLLKFISVAYRVAAPPQRSPKGLSVIIEREKEKSEKPPNQPQQNENQ